MSKKKKNINLIKNTALLKNSKNSYIKINSPFKDLALLQTNIVGMYQKYYRIIDGIYESY